MKEFFSNAWVISITSGILVFFITSLFIMLYNKFQRKRQIEEANQSVINHLRSYVVDNGLPEKEIIDAVRLSVGREYNIRDEDLLTNKAFCEELIKEIIGNIYISNQNKVTYLNMLKEYLATNKELNTVQYVYKQGKRSKKLELIISSIAAIVTSLVGVFASILTALSAGEEIFRLNGDIEVVTVVVLGISLVVIITYECYKHTKNKKK